MEKLNLTQNDTYVVQTPAHGFTPSENAPLTASQLNSDPLDLSTPHFNNNKTLLESQTKAEASDVKLDANGKKVYNPFPCSHCDGIFLSWGGLFMHK